MVGFQVEIWESVNVIALMDIEVIIVKLILFAQQEQMANLA